MPRIRLTRKFAPFLNGFDLSHATVGEVLSVSDEQAAMILREGWAEPTTDASGSTDEPFKETTTQRQP